MAWNRAGQSCTSLHGEVCCSILDSKVVSEICCSRLEKYLPTSSFKGHYGKDDRDIKEADAWLTRSTGVNPYSALAFQQRTNDADLIWDTSLAVIQYGYYLPVTIYSSELQRFKEAFPSKSVKRCPA